MERVLIFHSNPVLLTLAEKLLRNGLTWLPTGAGSVRMKFTVLWQCVSGVDIDIARNNCCVWLIVNNGKFFVMSKKISLNFDFKSKYDSKFKTRYQFQMKLTDEQAYWKFSIILQSNMDEICVKITAVYLKDFSTCEFLLDLTCFGKNVWILHFFKVVKFSTIFFWGVEIILIFSFDSEKVYFFHDFSTARYWIWCFLFGFVHCWRL